MSIIFQSKSTYHLTNEIVEAGYGRYSEQKSQTGLAKEILNIGDVLYDMEKHAFKIIGIEMIRRNPDEECTSKLK